MSDIEPEMVEGHNKVKFSKIWRAIENLPSLLTGTAFLLRQSFQEK